MNGYLRPRALALLPAVILAGCAAQPVPARPVAPAAITRAGIEQRPFVVQVDRYDMVCAVFDAIPPEGTVHLDCLVFDILAPADWAEKRWHLFVYNQVWSDPIDYGYRPGDVLEIDVSRFGQTREELDAMIASPEWMNSVWIPPELIRKVGAALPSS